MLRAKPRTPLLRPRKIHSKVSPPGSRRRRRKWMPTSELRLALSLFSSLNEVQLDSLVLFQPSFSFLVASCSADIREYVELPQRVGKNKLSRYLAFIALACSIF